MRRYQVIGDLIEQNCLKLGAEIGVQQGETFNYLLKRFPELKLYAVDRWAPQPSAALQTYYSWNHSHNEARVRYLADTTERGIVLKGNSADMADKVDDNSLDFVFIDADHSVRGVYCDMRAWWPKVRLNGFVMGHDFNWPSVEFVVVGLLGRVNFGDDNVWWVKRNGRLADWEPTEEQVHHYDDLTRNSGLLENRRRLRRGIRRPLSFNGKKVFTNPS